MSLYLEPVGVVEGAARDGASTRIPFERKCDVGAAVRTEFKPQPSATFIGAMLVTAQWTTGYLNILSAENCYQGICAAGTTLAKSAVTDVRSQRVALHAIPNGATETASLMEIRHAVSPFQHPLQ